MRIRRFRMSDVYAIASIEQAAALEDQRASLSEYELTAWLLDPEVDAASNAFVMTDDDDDLLVWGQAGTLEGIEGEIIGYTVLQFIQDAEGYHLRCQGAVHPAQRKRNAGRALLVGALNRARLMAAEFEFEAKAAGIPIYFEALLPATDVTAPRLAAKCAMQMIEKSEINGLYLYRSIM